MAEVIGYFADLKEEVESGLSAKDVFVALEVEEERVMVYCPIGQHSYADRDYVNGCRQITREKYIEVSKGLYTPEEYI